MTPNEIITVYLNPNFAGIFENQEGFVINDVTLSESFVSIEEYSVFKVEAVHFPMDRSVSLIDVKRPDGNDLGLLLLSKYRKFDSFGDFSLSEFLAYLVEVPVAIFGILPYKFQKDYLVVSQNFGEAYQQQYYHSAPIWGQFTHSPPPASHGEVITALTAMNGIALPSQHHLEAFSRYVHSKNPLERYLRLYHCVELLFDAVIVLKIKKLGADIREFSSIMGEHGKGELDRLRAISLGFITAPENLAARFVKVTNYAPLATKVFQDFSKDGNPVSPKDQSVRWQRLLSDLAAGRYRENDLNKSIIGKEKYDDFVCKTASYWIYRIRCSIAHSRVGEFILEDSEHDFIVEFAEPLLLEFVRQVFTAQTLHDLL